MKKEKSQPIKAAFLDRDGALIFEPQDTFQVDRIELVQILPGVIEGLRRLHDEGYKLIMITNQDGVGTASFPEKDFEAAQNAFLDMLKEKGISFYKVFVCPHFPKDNCRCRKPNTGLVDRFLKQEPIDRTRSFMVGDRDTDMSFAKNVGIRGYRMETNSAFPRIASALRTTKETDIFVQCNLDGQGISSISTGVKFFDHMLEQFSKHSLIDLAVIAKGDLHIDEHHTVEDVGLATGATLLSALGERRGINRYGFLLPMDDALVECAVDLGGRPYLVFSGEFKRERVGDLPTEMVEHFFRSVAEHLKANIHINIRYGKNEHHKIEATFKAFAKAMKMAVARDPRSKGELPTTKGML